MGASGFEPRSPQQMGVPSKTQTDPFPVNPPCENSRESSPGGAWAAAPTRTPPQKERAVLLIKKTRVGGCTGRPAPAPPPSSFLLSFVLFCGIYFIYIEFYVLYVFLLCCVFCVLGGLGRFFCFLGGAPVQPPRLEGPVALQAPIKVKHVANTRIPIH